MKIKELKEICEEYVAELIAEIADTKNEQRFLEYLDFCSRFHRYSFRNRVLIWFYKPDATFVAGFKAWQKMGRKVKKGATGIPIFAPMSIRKPQDPDEQFEDDADDRDLLLFKVVYVFDVSQTEGKDIPEMDILKVSGETQLLGPLETFTKSLGIQLIYSNKSLEFLRAAGVSARGRIYLKVSLRESQRFYVLSHELAHELLHDIQARQTLSTKAKELEADATAYVVARHFGLKTQSSAYLALYRVEEVDVKASLERIVSTASKIIRGIHEADNDQQEKPPILEAA
jgi:antirestriction protein ArdC